MEHTYIDEHSVAERYVTRRLTPEERDDFERHLVDCQECADRIVLANMFRARQQNGVRPAEPVPGPGPSLYPTPPSRALAGVAREDVDPEDAAVAALVIRVKPRQLLWTAMVSAVLLLAMVFLVLRVFARP